MKIGVWLPVTDVYVQDWLEYVNDTPFVIRYGDNLYLNDNFPMGTNKLLRDDTAKILILPKINKDDF